MLPLVHPNATNQFVVVKDAQRQRFLIVLLLHRLLYELKGMFLPRGFGNPIEPSMQVIPGTVYRVKQFRRILYHIGAEQYVIINDNGNQILYSLVATCVVIF